MQKKLVRNVLYMSAVILAVLAFGYVVLLNNGAYHCNSCAGHSNGEHIHNECGGRHH